MRVIYEQRRGVFVKVKEARLPHNRNFKILFRGMDWSGYHTLHDCIGHFDYLTNRPDVEDDNFTIVED